MKGSRLPSPGVNIQEVLPDPPARATRTPRLIEDPSTHPGQVVMIDCKVVGYLKSATMGTHPIGEAMNTPEITLKVMPRANARPIRQKSPYHPDVLVPPTIFDNYMARQDPDCDYLWLGKLERMFEDAPLR